MARHWKRWLLICYITSNIFVCWNLIQCLSWSCWSIWPCPYLPHQHDQHLVELPSGHFLHQVWTHPELGHCLQLPSSLCPVLQACQTIKPPATCQCRSSLSSSFTWDEHRQSAKGPCRSSFQGKPFCYVETPSSCPDLAKSSRWSLWKGCWPWWWRWQWWQRKKLPSKGRWYAPTCVTPGVPKIIIHHSSVISHYQPSVCIGINVNFRDKTVVLYNCVNIGRLWLFVESSTEAGWLSLKALRKQDGLRWKLYEGRMTFVQSPVKAFQKDDRNINMKPLKTKKMSMTMLMMIMLRRREGRWWSWEACQMGNQPWKSTALSSFSPQI